MTLLRFHDNVYPSYDYDYTVHHDASSHYHVAEASSQGRVLKPRMDVFEDPVRNLVTATFELPGVSQDNIAIDVFDNQLMISGEVASFFGENYGYVLRERRTGPFVRTLALPANIPVETIEATMEDGVLTICFPRIPPDEKPHRINVAPRTTESEPASSR